MNVLALMLSEMKNFENVRWFIFSWKKFMIWNIAVSLTPKICSDFGSKGTHTQKWVWWKKRSSGCQIISDLLSQCKSKIRNLGVQLIAYISLYWFNFSNCCRKNQCFIQKMEYRNISFESLSWLFTLIWASTELLSRFFVSKSIFF